MGQCGSDSIYCCHRASHSYKLALDSLVGISGISIAQKSECLGFVLFACIMSRLTLVRIETYLNMKKFISKATPAARMKAAEQMPAPPKIEFPCADYPIKVIGYNKENFQQFVLTFMEKYDANIDLSKVTHQDSKSGKFRSVRLFMLAQSEQQLKDFFTEIKATGRVVTVI